jgi:hypothetical protein
MIVTFAEGDVYVIEPKDYGDEVMELKDYNDSLQ